MRKIVETRSPLSNTIKDTSTIMHVTAFLREAIKMCETSVKIILLNEWRCRDAPCEK